MTRAEKLEKELKGEKRRAAQALLEYGEIVRKFSGKSFRYVTNRVDKRKRRFTEVRNCIGFMRFRNFSFDGERGVVICDEETVAMGRLAEYYDEHAVTYTMKKKHSKDLESFRNMSIYNTLTWVPDSTFDMAKEYVKTRAKIDSERFCEEQGVPSVWEKACPPQGYTMDFPFISLDGGEKCMVGDACPYLTVEGLLLVTECSREYVKKNIRAHRDSISGMAGLLQPCDMGYVRGREETCRSLEIKLELK